MAKEVMTEVPLPLDTVRATTTHTGGEFEPEGPALPGGVNLSYREAGMVYKLLLDNVERLEGAIPKRRTHPRIVEMIKEEIEDGKRLLQSIKSQLD